MNKIIVHVDINAFFAQAEQIKNPMLLNKPLIIGGHKDKNGLWRGVVSSCCYKSRKYGVKSGMPIFKAIKLCPNAIIKSCNFELYNTMSIDFFKLIKKHITNKIEIMSIDECYLDCSYVISRFKTLKNMAKYIQDLIFSALNLTISIGISWNKQLSKIASDYKKPLGITIINSKDVAFKLLLEEKINIFKGIGVKSIKALNQSNIFLVSDLFNIENRINIINIISEEKYNYYIEVFDENFVENVDSSIKIPKSISSSNTFDEKINDINLIYDYLKIHIEKNFKIMQNLKLNIYSISVFIKDSNFKTNSKTQTFNNPLQNIEEVLETSYHLLCKIYDNKKTYRLVGFAINHLNIDPNKYLDDSSKDVKDIVYKLNNEFNATVTFNGYLFYLLSKYLK